MWQATGHEMGVLEAFSNALGRIRRMPADHRILVHTGDASAHGHEEQLQLYQTMRDCGLRLHGHDPVGMVMLPAFRAGFQHVLDIPGNHDLWNGIILNPIVHHDARATYWPTIDSIRVRMHTFEVVLHGLCSTSGARAWQQFFAVGRYSPQDLEALRARVAATGNLPAGMTQIHVLATHHSPSVGSGRAHGIGAGARQDLQALCVQYNISVLLTGHDHSYTVINDPSLPVEVRASTVMQQNVWPQRQVRQFWLHRIRVKDRTLTWSAKPWRYENRRFVEIDRERAIFKS